MKQGKGFARGAEARKRAAAKKARPAPLVPKRTGASAIDKGPPMSDAHLRLVRAQQCIVSNTFGCVAHHPRELFDRTMGDRVSDYLCVPLRPDLHDGHNHSLHKTGMKRTNPVWWDQHGGTARVYRWLRMFLCRHYPAGHPGREHALAQIDCAATKTAQSGQYVKEAT